MSDQKMPASVSVEPLNTEERRWLKRLERVLIECPKRIGIYTIGDSELSVFDLPAYEAVEAAVPGKEDRDMVCVLRRHNLYLGSARSATKIHGVCG